MGLVIRLAGGRLLTRCHSLAIEFAVALRRVDSARVKAVSPVGWRYWPFFQEGWGVLHRFAKTPPNLPGKKRAGEGLYQGDHQYEQTTIVTYLFPRLDGNHRQCAGSTPPGGRDRLPGAPCPARLGRPLPGRSGGKRAFLARGVSPVVGVL